MRILSTFFVGARALVLTVRQTVPSVFAAVVPIAAVVPVAAIVAIAAHAPAALAQPARSIPENAEIGRLTLGVFPDATLDGKPVRLGAGARIRDQANIIQVPSTVTGEKKIAFSRGTMGEIVQVWILSDAEFKARADAIVAARRAAAQGGQQR